MAPAVLRFLSRTAGELLTARAAGHANRLLGAVYRAGGASAVPAALRFRALMATGQAGKALQDACRRLEATSGLGGSAMLRVPGYTPARRLEDAELREVALAAVRHPRYCDALLPLLEHFARNSSGAVVPLALYLQCSIGAGRVPNFDLASWIPWAAALQWPFRDQPPESLRPAAQQLKARFPNAEFLHELVEVIATAPRIRAGAPPWRDRLGAPLQFVPAQDAGARTLLLCFCGRTGQIGMPVHYFHRWVQHLPAHALYLRDPADDFYRSGIAELGPGWASLTEFVRGLVTVLGVDRIAAYGNSMGGFPAVRAGAEPGAGRIVSMSGRSGHDEELNEAPPEVLEAGRRRWRILIEAPLQASAAPPEIACIYGAESRLDAADAQTLAGLPGVRLEPLPEYRRHNTGIKLAVAGGLERVLAWLAGATDELFMA